LKKLSLVLFAFSLCLPALAQYFQQKVDYVIDVKLNEAEKTLDAFEKITYTNNAPDTLRFIWFHLWPNAYKNDRTAFSDQLLGNGNTKYYFSAKEHHGYINRLDFKVNGITARVEDHPTHIDIIKLVLPSPLPPGAQAIITTPFHEKLPFNFSRGGFDGNSFQVTQWFPKPAVYDAKGWHAMPYLDQGEFFDEFGDYDVRITVPKNFVVAATGVLQNEEEKIWLNERIAESKNKRTAVNEKSKVKPPPKKSTVTPSKKVAPPTIETKTLNYKQDSIHDFAWFANPDYVAGNDTVEVNGKVIHVQSFYTLAEAPTWKESVQYAKDAIRFYSAELGPYPYPTVTVVQGPQSFGGGMEYPTITIISPLATAKELDQTIAHEIGHNWFQGMLATNERDYPWMDEGINTFYEYKYMEEKYGPQPKENELLFQTKALRKTDQPVETTSEDFSENNYFLVAYHKTAEWMRSLESALGKERLRSVMQSYFQEWKFRHPYPEDLKDILKSKGGATDQQLQLHASKGILPDHHLQGFKFVSPIISHSIKNYMRLPSKNILAVSPAIGANHYDRFMIGGLVTNYKLPPNKFNFLLVPLYATGSKKFTGLGKLNFSIASGGFIRKTDLFFNASRFSMDEFTDTAGNKLIMQFDKMVPGIKFTFREKDPRSSVRKYLQWKTYRITEQSLDIEADTTIIGTDTSLFLHYYLPKHTSWINQLRFTYENARGLYPFNFSVNIDQSHDFLRPTFTGNYFFNYREGGLSLRLFAGKFFYLKSKTLERQFANDRYFLNMTGPKGYEDYTYSDYFLGRNEFEGLESQQIMIRDGGFKVRSDLLAQKIGKTDNWLAAINLNSSVPDKINPLSLLPIKIPLHIFADIGTYAEAWDRDEDNDRFLFDMGFHIPLLNEVINIYIPVLYNKVYSDYFKSTIQKNRFLKTISFSINLNPESLKEVNREVEF
jgi:hypothetical protein